MLHRMLLFIIGLLSLCMATACFAKNINLYDQPKADAKVIATIDPTTGIVPIYTPKQSEWAKVGDPTNGNVGWVKSSDLASAAKTPNGFSVNQQITSNGKDPQSVLMQFGTSSQLTPEQKEALYKQIQAQQAIIQNSFQQILQNTSMGLNTIPVIPKSGVKNQPAPTPSNGVSQ
jgi:SH3-like domain-containing protein